MIGNDVEGTLPFVLHAKNICCRLDDVCEQINLVIAVHALHDSGDTLEPHAGIDRWRR